MEVKQVTSETLDTILDSLNGAETTEALNLLLNVQLALLENLRNEARDQQKSEAFFKTYLEAMKSFKTATAIECDKTTRTLKFRSKRLKWRGTDERN
jgi:hypothetical protein